MFHRSVSLFNKISWGLWTLCIMLFQSLKPESLKCWRRVRIMVFKCDYNCIITCYSFLWRVTWSSSSLWQQYIVLYMIVGSKFASMQVSIWLVTGASLQEWCSSLAMWFGLVIWNPVPACHWGASCLLYTFNSCELEWLCKRAWSRLGLWCLSATWTAHWSGVVSWAA